MWEFFRRKNLLNTHLNAINLSDFFFFFLNAFDQRRFFCLQNIFLIFLCNLLKSKIKFRSFKLHISTEIQFFLCKKKKDFLTVHWISSFFSPSANKEFILHSLKLDSLSGRCSTLEQKNILGDLILCKNFPHSRMEFLKLSS